MNKHSLACLFGIWMAVAPASVHAYAYETHSTLVEYSVEAMLRVNDLNPAPPDGVSTAEFGAYKLRVSNAIERLKELRTGLPNNLQGNGLNPVLPIGPGDEDYPFQSSFTDEPDPNNPGQTIRVEHQPDCDLNPDPGIKTTNVDLSDISVFKVTEFDFLPSRTAEDGCGLTALDPDPTVDNSNLVLQKVLGWHAGGVDDRANDTVMWFKPLNTLVFSAINDIAIEATNAALGTIVLLGYCVAKLFELEICDPDEAYALAEKYNPVTQVLGLLPGIGDWRDADKFSGLWHFIHVDREGEAVHNNIPGIDYLDAADDVGLVGPGALDVAFIAMADTGGVSLNAWASDGDDFYGQFDDDPRLSAASWMPYSFAHVEFSPLDNLARYGWEKQYLDTGAESLAGLAWPLHALGDATAPHHLIGSSSYGHVPFEEGAAANHALILPSDSVPKNNQLRRILQKSFEWSQTFATSGHNVETLIEEVAKTARAMVSPNTIYNNWPYVDFATVQDLVGDTQEARAHFFPDRAFQTQELIELSMAATIALLTVAGEEAGTPASLAVACAGGHFKIGTGCVGDVPLQSCPGQLPQCDASNPCPSTTVFNCVEGCCLLVVQ